jgi:5-methylthioribose kinase
MSPGNVLSVLELTAENAVQYLRDAGRLPRRGSVRVDTLGWGVSNLVLRIMPEGGQDFVIKQSREQLRTRADWRSRLDRIWREVDVMRVLERLLPAGAVPRVLFEDRSDFLFGMEAVAADHVVWKESLLAGEVDPVLADVLADDLARVHSGTSGDASLQASLGDQQVFDELRIDPFYRRIAAAHADLADPIHALMADMSLHPLCLVLGDFSPKNILLTGGRVVLVDFETGHYGDPGFDLGFFMSHLALKALRHGNAAAPLMELLRRFWCNYVHAAGWPERTLAALEPRSIRHWGACMLARVDGKSPVDYLLPKQQAIVREFTRRMLQEPPRHFEPALDAFQERTARSA